jgi:hypothetical protein
MGKALQRDVVTPAFRVVPQTAAEMRAVLAFNERMRAAHADADFLLPDQPNGAVRLPGRPSPPVEWTKLVVLDQQDEVRGGFLLMTQQGWIQGEVRSVANYQGPLSEGIHDAKFGMVGLQMLRHLQRHWPLAFAVGMGGMDRPLPRLLQAAGWTVNPVPFLFHIVGSGRVLRELRVLQRRTPVRLAARAAAMSGAGALAVAALQFRSLMPGRGTRGLQLERVQRWGAWADALWHRTRDASSFAVVRDRATLESLYPLEDPRYLAFAARRGRDVVGWAVALDTQMRDHNHFGNLRVATILDARALAADQLPLAARLRDVFAQDADLIVTNQSHASWVDAFRGVGFLTGPSNYLLAMSKPLSQAIGDASARIHITRGDGDGRIHL